MQNPADSSGVLLGICEWVDKKCLSSTESLGTCLDEIQTVYDKTLDRDLAGTLACTMSDVVTCMNKISNIELAFRGFRDLLAVEYGVQETTGVAQQIEHGLAATTGQTDPQSICATVCALATSLLQMQDGSHNPPPRVSGSTAIAVLSNSMPDTVETRLSRFMEYLQQNLWAVLMYILWAQYCCCYASMSKARIDKADAVLLERLEEIVRFKDEQKHLRRFALDPLLQSTIDDIRKAILFIQHEAANHASFHNIVEHDGKNNTLYRIITEGRHLFFDMNCVRPVAVLQRCLQSHTIQTKRAVHDRDDDISLLPMQWPRMPPGAHYIQREVRARNPEKETPLQKDMTYNYDRDYDSD